VTVEMDSCLRGIAPSLGDKIMSSALEDCPAEKSGELRRYSGSFGRAAEQEKGDDQLSSE